MWYGGDVEGVRPVTGRTGDVEGVWPVTGRTRRRVAWTSRPANDRANEASNLVFRYDERYFRDKTSQRCYSRKKFTLPVRGSSLAGVTAGATRSHGRGNRTVIYEMPVFASTGRAPLFFVTAKCYPEPLTSHGYTKARECTA